MDTEEKTTVAQQSESSKDIADDGDYIDAITNLKATTVSKEQYEKLKAENKKLLNAVINGEELPKEAQQKKVDVNELRKKLFSADSDLTNLEYAQCAVDLRNALLEQEGYDCFAPRGTNYQMTPEDITGPERLATALQDAIDYAQGDSALFTQELMRVTKNDSPLKSAMSTRRN